MAEKQYMYTMADLKFMSPTDTLRREVDLVFPEKISSIVVFDIKTTDLAYPSSEIIELAACEAYSEAQPFHAYINPVKAEITNFTKELTNFSQVNGILFKNLVPVPSEPVQSVLENFMKFLEQKPDSRVILVSHNSNFDMKFLILYIKKCNLLERFLNCVVGFADTLEAAGKLLDTYPKDCGVVPDYKLTTLFRYFTKTKVEFPHDAEHHVIALRTILPRLMRTKRDVADSSYNMGQFVKFRGDCDAAEEMESLLCIQGVTPLILYKIAKRGTRLDSLLSKASEGSDAFTAWFLELNPFISPKVVPKLFEFLRDFITLGEGNEK